MKDILLGASFIMLFASFPLYAQVANDADGNFDSTSYVETDSNTNNTSNVTSNNTNTNNTTINSTNTNNNNTVIDSTNTNTNTNNTTVNSTATNSNTNVNTSTVTSTATNNNNSTINSTSDSTVTSTNTNNNTNNSTINQTTDSTIDQTINQTTTSDVTSNNTNNNTNNTTIDSTSANTNNNNNVNDSTITQKVIAPPPSAIAPTIMSGGNDTCTVTYSAAVQTQILGASGGGHVRDVNCERLKNSRALYNMGMKVAAVSLMCQDPSIFKAMEMAGTPCPFMGEIGDKASEKWAANPVMHPSVIEEETRNHAKVEGIAIGGVLMLLLLAL